MGRSARTRRRDAGARCSQRTLEDHTQERSCCLRCPPTRRKTARSWRWRLPTTTRLRRRSPNRSPMQPPSSLARRAPGGWPAVGSGSRRTARGIRRRRFPGALFDPSARIVPGTVTLRDAFELYPSRTRWGGRADRRRARGDARARRALLRALHVRSGPVADRARRYGFNFDAAQGVSYEIDLTRPPVTASSPASRRPAARSGAQAQGGGQQLPDERWRRVRGDPPRSPHLALDRGRCAICWWPTFGGGAAWNRPRTTTGRCCRITCGFASGRSSTCCPPRSRAEGRSASLAPSRAGAARRSGLLARSRLRVARAQALRSVADVPDSLEPWLDGLLRRKVLVPRANRSISAVRDGADPHRAGLVRARRAPGVLCADDELRRSWLPARSAGRRRRSERRRDRRRALIATRWRAPRFSGWSPTRASRPCACSAPPTSTGAILPGARERRSSRNGWSPVLAAHLERLRSENPFGTVLVDGGNWYQAR